MQTLPPNALPELKSGRTLSANLGPLASAAGDLTGMGGPAWTRRFEGQNYVKPRPAYRTWRSAGMEAPPRGTSYLKDPVRQSPELGSTGGQVPIIRLLLMNLNPFVIDIVKPHVKNEDWLYEIIALRHGLIIVDSGALTNSYDIPCDLSGASIDFRIPWRHSSAHETLEFLESTKKLQSIMQGDSMHSKHLPRPK